MAKRAQDALRHSYAQNRVPRYLQVASALRQRLKDGRWAVGDKIATLNKMRYHLPECGGSDAHFKPVVGTTYTTYPGRGAADFRRALVEHTTRPGSGHTPSLLVDPADTTDSGALRDSSVRPRLGSPG